MAAVAVETVPAAPFIEWLRSQGRADWTNWLTDTQVRYVERVLQRSPARVNVHSVDDVLVTLGQEHLLSILYPD